MTQLSRGTLNPSLIGRNTPVESLLRTAPQPADWSDQPADPVAGCGTVSGPEETPVEADAAQRETIRALLEATDRPVLGSGRLGRPSTKLFRYRLLGISRFASSVTPQWVCDPSSESVLRRSPSHRRLETRTAAACRPGVALRLRDASRMRSRSGSFVFCRSRSDRRFHNEGQSRFHGLDPTRTSRSHDGTGPNPFEPGRFEGRVFQPALASATDGLGHARSVRS